MKISYVDKFVIRLPDVFFVWVLIYIILYQALNGNDIMYMLKYPILLWFLINEYFNQREPFVYKVPTFKHSCEILVKVVTPIFLVNYMLYLFLTNIIIQEPIYLMSVMGDYYSGLGVDSYNELIILIAMYISVVQLCSIFLIYIQRIIIYYIKFIPKGYTGLEFPSINRYILEGIVKAIIQKYVAVIDGKVTLVSESIHYTEYKVLFKDLLCSTRVSYIAVTACATLAFTITEYFRTANTNEPRVFVIGISFFFMYVFIHTWGYFKIEVEFKSLLYKKEALHRTFQIIIFTIFSMSLLTNMLFITLLNKSVLLIFVVGIIMLLYIAYWMSINCNEKGIDDFINFTNIRVTDTTKLIEGPQNILFKLDEESTTGVERELLFSFFENKKQQAVLLAGMWGSGKTHTIQKLFDKYEEVDLLKYGSGQNLFYAIYKRLYNPFNPRNFKMNILNICKNFELIYVIITLNLTWMPLIIFFKDLFIYNGEINGSNLIKLVGTIAFFNMLVVHFISEVIFTKDIRDNRFRKMYLDAIVNYSYGKILVFENIDRLNFDEFNQVLEIVNYLNDEGIKVIVTADIEYLYNESKFSEKKFIDGESDNDLRSYFELYLSRYFKDIVYISSDVEEKVKVMKQILRDNKVFVAPQEWPVIVNILKTEKTNKNHRELEYFVNKYKSKPVINQFSYELFLHVNKLNYDRYNDFCSIPEKLQKDWGRYVLGINESKYSKTRLMYQSSKDCSSYLLFTDNYDYAYRPAIEVKVVQDKISCISYNIDKTEKEFINMQKHKVYNLGLSTEENILFKKVQNTNELNIVKEMVEASGNYKHEKNISYNDYMERVFKDKIKKHNIKFDSDLTLNNVLCKIYIDFVMNYNY